ncbi:MAG: hypothetical protein D6828_03570 [Nitrospirae bacterium]|nr:MAG: hypothetical protein D6828_03570 [Nitrospirota bacterium]
MTFTLISAYLLAIFISLLVATSELFTKFKDEPFKILGYKSAWIYLSFNALIAVVCLYILTKTDILGSTTASDLIKASLTAGFGSTILMRSKFFKANIGDKEVAVGPEMIINVFLETLETKIDRERALIRKELVEKIMSNINFDEVKDYVVTTILASLQNPSQEMTRSLMDEIEKISESEMDDQEKSFALGYLIIDIMGEDFLKRFF